MSIVSSPRKCAGDIITGTAIAIGAGIEGTTGTGVTGVGTAITGTVIAGEALARHNSS
jgi:hypothetical protein